MRKLFLTALVGAFTLTLGSAAMAQTAVTGFSGGSPFGIFHGGSTGDVVGYRFTVNQPIIVTNLGMWIDSDGVGSTHQAGIWDSSQSLLTSTTIDPNSLLSFTQSGFLYQPTTPVTLTPGITYTAGVLYTATDGDSYLSSVSNLTTSPDVNWIQSVFPDSGSLGFTYPTSNSTAGGRLGPNFTYVIPEPASLGLLGGLGLLALRRRTA